MYMYIDQQRIIMAMLVPRHVVYELTEFVILAVISNPVKQPCTNTRLFSGLELMGYAGLCESLLQWQKRQIDHYCKKYGLDKLNNTLPTDPHIREKLYRHLIFDDKKKLLFCFIPKVCCMQNIIIMVDIIMGVVSVSADLNLYETF